MSAREDERRSIFRSTVGGVLTDEVGAVTGDLELQTLLDPENLCIYVRYAGADEWYTVTGSPVSPGDRSYPADTHERVVEHLTIPGPVVDGNEEPASLRGFSLT
ncbi:MAG: hypothetical protein LC781_01205 [Actinobacteria bacterium]|nr:hypothetical protein [Actinomycetota bacterium]